MFVEPARAPAGSALRLWQRVVDGWADARPRDVWNDLRAAGFLEVDFEHVVLRGRAGLPAVHVVGNARRSDVWAAATRATPLAWRDGLAAPAFFG